ncbi:MAG TPA: IclR family transcriptional regulator [Noviherbaspirillum sp.]
MSYTVDAVSQAMELLFLVAEHPGLGVTELAKRSGNTKARAFRLLGTLEEKGLVRRQEPFATYYLGAKSLFLGAAGQSQVTVASIAATLLPEIGRQCNESVLVRVREGTETVCVALWESPHAVRVHSQLGHRRELYYGASGKLLLAHAPEEVQEAVLNAKREKFTPNTITGRAQLEKELKKIREQGYSVSLAEKAADTVAVAAPIRDARGTVVASVSMSAPASRVVPNDLQKYIELIREGAARFSHEFGYVEQHE